MDLPRNIVQIGKPDKLHKIFVEDYVVSYIKQLNRKLNGRTAGLAFYGRRTTEGNVRYYFLYGAAQVPGLEGRGQYLSELERESIEEKQREYFENYDFLAWCSISGELPEGFYLHEQGKGLSIDGYACFYEKNECMLNFMLATGNQERAAAKEDAPPSPAVARRTQEGGIDRRLEGRRKAETPVPPVQAERAYRRERAAAAAPRKKEGGTSGMRFAVVTVAVFLCIVGVVTLGDADKLKELQVVARQVIENLSEKKLPDIEEEPSRPMDFTSRPSDGADGAVSGNGVPGLAGNAETGDGIQSGAGLSGQSQTGQNVAEQPGQAEQSGQAGQPQTGLDDQGQGVREQEKPQDAQNAEGAGNAEPADAPAQNTVTYVIEKGDTLLNICRSRYGSEGRLKEICELNNITDADDIKIGQIILLPE